jgi:hypothetical protein
VMVFNDFLEMFEKLRPTIVVADSYPRKLQPTITRLGGATFLRLGDLKAVSEVRRNNGLRKTDEDDVKVLRQIFYEAPGLFQPLYASPLELEVRALTELWVELAGIKRAAKYTRTTTDDPLAVETHKILRRYTERLATRIHEKAMELPLYRMAVKKLSEERKNNGLKKTDENDVKALRQMFYKTPDLFQPLYTFPVELEVRALAELWVELAGIKKAAKYTRTTTNDPLAVQTHKILRRYTERLATRIHEKAMELPLYRMAVERLGLRGPSLAYIISHDGLTLKTMSRERLIFRFQLTGRRRYKKRNMKSRLMIILARSVVFNKHQGYYQVHQRFFERFQTEGYGRKRAFWKSILRVAERILKDLHTLAKSQTPRSF